MNLTRAFVETMLRALSQWHKDFYDTAAAKRTAKPFYIRNETGMDFTFWITGTQMRWKLDSGSEKPLEFMALEAKARPLGQRYQQQNLTTTISIQFTDIDDATDAPGNGKSLCNLPFNQGTSSHILSYLPITCR